MCWYSLVDARVRGEEIIVSPGTAEVTRIEAAVLLDMSRPQVRRLMDRDLLEFRKVGPVAAWEPTSVSAYARDRPAVGGIGVWR
jgi:hypothetical protein